MYIECQAICVTLNDFILENDFVQKHVIVKSDFQLNVFYVALSGLRFLGITIKKICIEQNE